jgi:tRNA(Ile)-lysidine synthase
MVPEPELVERFRRDLGALTPPDSRIGVAVSGGADSLALLLMAAAARPGAVEAATVDHQLRAESRAEADMVAAVCERLGVPHAILTVEWNEKPSSAIQERAREARYTLLGGWIEERGLGALATAHHLDDQAETLMMRLNRGSGVRGLGAMRPTALLPGSDLPLLRPLLEWRRSELERVCGAAGIAPAADPSNDDEQFERVRIRRALAAAEWLDPEMLGRSAAHLASADEALGWAAEQEWNRSVTEQPGEIAHRPSDASDEIVRRIIARAVSALATEGPPELRGGELDRLLEGLRSGRTATLRGVRCSGGAEWRFVPAPKRTRPADNLR